MSGDVAAVKEVSPGYGLKTEAANSLAGYKQTEKGIIPASWKTIELGKVLTLQRGYDLPHRLRTPGSVPIVSSAGISGSHSNGKVAPPCVVTGRYGTIGDVFYVNEPCWPLNTTLYVKDFKENHPKFIYYLLSTVDFESHSGKSGVPGVNRNDVHKEVIVCPTIEEQRAIATALSDVDVLLEELDRLIAKKRDLKQATMQQLLTGQTRLLGFEGEWETIRLGDHANFLRNGTNSRAELASDGAVKYLHYGDIHACSSATLKPDNLPYLPDHKAKSLDKLQAGDLVFADASEDMDGVGKSVEIIGVDEAKVVSGLHTIAVRFSKSVLADGFKAYLQNCPSFNNQLRRLAAGTKVYATTRRHIASIELALPCVEEQKAIAFIFSAMDTEIEALEKRRAKTSAIKQAMMQELLTGRTRLI